MRVLDLLLRGLPALGFLEQRRWLRVLRRKVVAEIVEGVGETIQVAEAGEAAAVAETTIAAFSLRTVQAAMFRPRMVAEDHCHRLQVMTGATPEIEIIGNESHLKER
jgi:CheY-like chemotaxis protein